MGIRTLIAKQNNNIEIINNESENTSIRIKLMPYKKEKKLHYHLHIKNSHTDEKKFMSLIESLKITRELVNDPSNSVHPKTVEEEVHKLFGKHKHIKIHVIKGKELEKK